MKKLNLTSRLAALVVPITLGLSGCHYHEAPPPPPPPCYWGMDGATGNAFFTLNWSADAPSYLWTNNPGIPAVFQYGGAYLSPPGTFELYYEGTFVENCCPRDYHWDVFFDIWVHPGSAGGCGWDGVPGADSYLTIVCGPYGPWEERFNKTTPQDVIILKDTEDEIVLRRTLGDLQMQVTYKKRTESRKAELSATEVKVALSDAR